MDDSRILQPESNNYQIKLVKNSGLFDVSWYSNLTNVAKSDVEAIAHYINFGEDQGFSPSILFDPIFYGISNPDVKKENINKLLHYIKYGKQEGRYPTAEASFGDSELIHLTNTSRLDNLSIEDDNFTHLSPAQKYLCFWRHGARVNDVFDEIFYLNFYPDVVHSEMQPYIHYLKIGMRDARIQNISELDYIVSKIKPRFEAEYYKRQAIESGIIVEEYEDPFEHYLKIGCFKGLSPNSQFDPVFYLLQNPDIQNAGINPFYHYVNHGLAEGRPGKFNLAEYICKGGQPFIYSRPTILIASHEASRTGAPLVGLNLITAFQKKYNVIAYIGNSGELTDLFLNESSMLVKGPVKQVEFMLKQLKTSYGLSAIIMNSVETDSIAQGSAIVGIPTIALVHEFAEYTLPAGRVSDIVRRVDKVIVPARIIKLSIESEIKAISGGSPQNIRIMPQGKLPWIPYKSSSEDMTLSEISSFVRERCSGRPKVVLGAGAIGIRKGLDLFVQTAYYLNKIRNDVSFIWVGAGYSPKLDVSYSVWIGEMIERMDLNKVIQFVPEQSNISPALDLCDVFFMSSRMDPFPNVVIDALEANKPIVCFKRGTGCAELIEDGEVDGKAVDYCDVVAAAEAINDILLSDQTNCKNRSKISELFDFQEYVRIIEEEIFIAQVARSNVLKKQRTIDEISCFDASFYCGRPIPTMLRSRELADYAISSSNGLARRNPRPGFSDFEYRNRNSILAGEIPLAEAILNLDEGGCPLTHRSLKIEKSLNKVSDLPRCAVHIHLHYSETAIDIAQRLQSKGRVIDFVLTVTNQKAFVEVSEVFSKRNFRNAKVLLVPNKGRDLGYFLTDFGKELESKNYDVIGHFHGKKSYALGGNTGDLWRDFLLDTLIGKDDGTLDFILNLFTGDKDLGLVFAEDPNCVGWSKNLAPAKMLAQRLKPELKLPDQPVFPLGTMFWARPNAISSLWGANITLDELPEEPAPYDGTILHSIERILPAICESLGHTWLTVYNKDLMR